MSKIGLHLHSVGTTAFFFVHPLKLRSAAPNTAPCSSSLLGSREEAPDYKCTGPKVKALPKIPVVSNGDQEHIEILLESKPRLTAKEKGKGKAIDFLPRSISQNMPETDTSNYGLLTPPESAIMDSSPNTSPLSGLRGIRPRGPRTRRSTIC
jgi:hypothetical protein